LVIPSQANRTPTRHHHQPDGRRAAFDLGPRTMYLLTDT
jgi:hypothetical protein